MPQKARSRVRLLGYSRVTRVVMVDSIAFSKRVRSTSLEMVARAGASHIGSALSIADILSVLYAEVLAIDPGSPAYPLRDRLILSKGHACVSLYASLYHRGVISRSMIDTYGQNGSILMSHVSHHVPGVEFSTGSLGHGLPFATGKALMAKRKNELWRTFVILGDGELQEGSNWEAMMFASYHGLHNLIMIIDANNLQSLTTVQETLSIEPLAERVAAFGWAVDEIDGHNHEQLRSCLSRVSDRPRCIIARTVKGKGVSFMENQVSWHYRSPSPEELEIALQEIADA